MSSAIILNAASANLFWSSNGATTELGLELELRGSEGLEGDTSLLDAAVG